MVEIAAKLGSYAAYAGLATSRGGPNTPGLKRCGFAAWPGWRWAVGSGRLHRDVGPRDRRVGGVQTMGGANK